MTPTILGLALAGVVVFGFVVGAAIGLKLGKPPFRFHEAAKRWRPVVDGYKTLALLLLLGAPSTFATTWLLATGHVASPDIADILWAIGGIAGAGGLTYGYSKRSSGRRARDFAVADTISSPDAYDPGPPDDEAPTEHP